MKKNQKPHAAQNSSSFSSPERVLPTAKVEGRASAAPSSSRAASGTQPPPPVKRKKRKKKIRPLTLILDLLIAVCILGAAYLFGIRYYHNYMNDQKTMQLLRNQAEGRVDEKTGQIGIWIDPKANPVSGEGGYDTPNGLVDSSGHKQDSSSVFVEVIGQMTIDKINLNMPIVWGCDYPQLQVGLGWYQKSAEIGQEGNCVILGHRMLEYGRHFNRLDEVKEDDRVRISTRKGSYTYKVKSTQRVSVPEMFNYFEPHEGKTELTLVTCSNDAANTRILVLCELEKFEAAKAKS